jgi:hypothetical protein
LPRSSAKKVVNSFRNQREHEEKVGNGQTNMLAGVRRDL